MEEKIVKLVQYLGRPAKELDTPFVRALCLANAASFFQSYTMQMIDRYRFPTPSGELKVASFNVMNFKYVGLFKVILGLHIVSGTTAVLGGAASVYLEKSNAAWSEMLAKISSKAEAFVHAPTALAMSPFVYGDKRVSVPVYILQSLLLQLSALRASIEADEPEKKKSRPELRRMLITLGVFQYVRLFSLLAGLNGFLQPDKYTLSIMTAGFTMLPLAWNGAIFPVSFWAMVLWNWRQAHNTGELIRLYGVDQAAKIQAKQALH